MKTLRTVVVLTSNPRERYSLVKALERADCWVHGVASEQEAEKRLQEGDVGGLVIWWEPHLNSALEAAMNLSRRFLNIPLVVAGSSKHLSDFDALEQAHGLEYVSVPLEGDEVVQALRRALARQFLVRTGDKGQTIQNIIKAFRILDIETEEHCQRVAETTARLAQAGGIDQVPLLESIRWGAYLHDIGKVGIPARILHKPAALSPEEWRVMKKHPEIGFTMLSQFHFLKDSLDVVRYHHERFDGTGYPFLLRGEEIPREARMVALADSVDAMISHRPYRQSLSWPTVFRELKENSGGQFDPELVQLALADADWIFGAYERAQIISSTVMP